MQQKMLQKNYKKTAENKKVIKNLNSDKDISDTVVYFTVPALLELFDILRMFRSLILIFHIEQKTLIKNIRFNQNKIVCLLLFRRSIILPYNKHQNFNQLNINYY